MPIIIAILTDGIAPFETGGMQSYCAELVKSLKNKDAVIWLFHTTLHGDSKAAQQFLLPHPHKVFYVEYPAQLAYPAHYLAEQKKLSRAYYDLIIEQPQKPCVIYAHGFTGCYKGFNKRAKEKKIPLVINLHGMNMFQEAHGFKNKLINMFMRFMAKKSIRNANGIVVLGDAMYNVLPNVASAKTIIKIPCAIDDDFPGTAIKLKSGKVKFLFVGRNDAVKGMDTLIKAIKFIEKTEGLKVDLTVVGNWEPAMFDGLDSVVNLTGNINDKNVLKKIYAEHHVLVVPSYSEGFPLVIIEAMSHGCMIIASSVGCIPEIKSGGSVRLVEARNSNSLAENMLFFLKSTENDFNEIRNKAISCVKENYTWSLIATKTYNFLTSFIQR